MNARDVAGASPHASELLTAAAGPYRRAGRYAWHFARGKLGRDPVFRHLLREGLIAPGARVLDLGCGQGLLASLLEAAGTAAQAGRWPAGWAAAPLGCRVTGIDRSVRDVQRARIALPAAEFIDADLRRVAFPSVDVVVILDVLHYIEHAEHDAVLARVRAALPTGGLLLLRVGDAAATHGFRFSQWVDRLVTRLRDGRSVPRAGRTLADWTARLEALGFVVQAQPMSHGTPFANVLLVGRAERAPAARPAVDRSPAAASRVAA